MALWVGGFVVVAACIAALTSNPELTVASVLALGAIFLLLWKHGKAAALLFICCMQWLQASAKVLHADLLGVELWTMTEARSIEQAVYLTLAWVVLLAVGARLALRGMEVSSGRESVSVVGDLRSLLLLYAVWSLGSVVLQVVPAGGARQLVVALVHMRWAVVFAIFAHVLVARRGWLVMWSVFAIEVASGFLAFFSEFKVPLFLLAIAAISAGHKFAVRQVAVIAVAAIASVYLGVVWSAIKMDYRDRLNEGTGAQVIAIDTESQIRELIELVGSVDADVLGYGLERLVERIAYVDYFALAIDYVPAMRPHEGGRLWLDAVLHILMPRILFPDKPVLPSDTEVTAMYTGLATYRAGRGTSISLGLPAITYVDLGPIWMLPFAVLVGLLHGGAYRYLWTRAPGDPLAQGFASAVVIGFIGVGASAQKVLGGQITTFLVAAAVWHIAPAIVTRLRRPGRTLAGEARRP